MSRNGNVRGSSIDKVVAVGVNRVVCTLGEIHIGVSRLYAVCVSETVGSEVECEREKDYLVGRVVCI